MHLWHAHEVQGALSTIDMTSIIGEISPHLCSNSAGSETMHLSKEMTIIKSWGGTAGVGVGVWQHFIKEHKPREY